VCERRKEKSATGERKSANNKTATGGREKTAFYNG